jgi:hypothetical protein
MPTAAKDAVPGKITRLPTEKADDMRADANFCQVLLDGECIPIDMSSQTGMGTDGYPRQEMVEDFSSVERTLVTQTDLVMRTGFILRGRQEKCCKSRITSLGRHRYYLLL